MDCSCSILRAMLVGDRVLLEPVPCNLYCKVRGGTSKAHAAAVRIEYRPSCNRLIASLIESLVIR